MVNLINVGVGMMEWAALTSAAVLLVLILFLWMFYSWGKAKGKAEAYESVMKGRKLEVKEAEAKAQGEEKKA